MSTSESMESLPKCHIHHDELEMGGYSNQGHQDLVAAKNIKDSVVHMFLPKRTPTSSRNNLEDTEEFILQAFCASLTDAIAEVPFPELEPVQVMFEKWVKIQPKMFSDIEPISNFQHEVSTLQNGHTLPIYVRKQNSTLFITKQSSDGAFKIATFRSSLPSETVMSTVNSRTLRFPETDDIVHHSEMLKSQAFAMHLHELAVGEVDISQKRTTTSGGDECRATREVVDPYLVSDWIIGLLVPGSIGSPLSSAVSMEKKIRDQVNLYNSPGSASKLPFRRSGMYMSLKVSLQLKLIQVLGSVHNAKLVYKIMLLRVLADITKQFCDLDRSNETIDMDLTSQLLSKLGIRAMKLDDPSWDTSDNSDENIWNNIIILKSRCLEYTRTIVERLQEQIQTLWKRVAEPESKNSIEPAIDNDMDEDSLEKNLHHHLQLVDEFIHKLKSSEGTHPADTPKEHIISAAVSQSFSRYLTIESIEKANVQMSTSNIWLHDTENFIKYECGNIGASGISKLVTLYVEKARNFGIENPIRMSQMFLVCLKGLELIDRIATNEHPLLLQYSPAINSEAFDSSLLPHRKDMELLEELLHYFKERQKRAKYSSGILDSANVGWDTFSVQFALQNRKMISLRNRILEETEAAVEKKYKEVDSVRGKCLKLQNQIKAQGYYCRCEYKEQWDSTKNKMKKHLVKRCNVCSQKLRLKSLRKSVSTYERPPPPQEVFQYAVVFELLIPDVLAIWRDFMAYFKCQILGEAIFSDVKHGVSKNWLDYSRISSYKTTNNPSKVCLGSTVMPSSHTHHNKTQKLDVLSERNEDFIRNNGMNCFFHYQDKRTLAKCVNKTCTFQLSTTSDYTPYENLQTCVESTTHSQNAIISAKSACHSKLQLPEFVAFGSLRAGHRIQLRNLYESIFSGKLSLEQEPVVVLILQTIWQLGPRNAENERESHLDFQDNIFATEFLEMLDKLVKTNEANYGNSLILLTAVIITRRIQDLNTSLTDKCYVLLKNWRNILGNWMGKILGAMDAPDTASIYGGMESLRKNLLEVILCSIYSYNVADDSDLKYVMRDEQDVVHWLQALYQLHQLEETPDHISKFLQTLLHFGKLTALRLALDERIHQSDLKRSILSFICEQWNKAEECILYQNEVVIASPRRDHVLLAEFLEEEEETGEKIHHFVTFDLYMGTFLVNGFSQSSLSLQVKEDELFQRYFNQNGIPLRVRQDTKNVTRTVAKYQGRHYEFNHGDAASSVSNNSSDSVIIREVDDNSQKLVLLNPEKFDGLISDYFIANYSHWLDPIKNIIYFRPLNDSQSHSHQYELEKRMSNNSWILTDVRTGEFIFSIMSNGFDYVTKCLERLEMSRFINVSLNPDRGNLITAHLRRYNLRFTTNSGNEALESVEYPGYSISVDQKSKGTLIGLHHGLLLQDKEKRMLIVPHSSIRTVKTVPHQTSVISLETLRQPSCFTYEFDDVLKRLKANNSKSAWLYLAALHAVTSSTLPDPFTEITGTEMAVRILQSACVWSCSPYDNESLATLKFIKSLSPDRNYYGHFAPRKRDEDKGTMEMTTWPPGLPPMVAYDGFALVVEKMLQESEKLSMLHLKSTDEDSRKEKNKSSEKLRIRAYSRYLKMYNPAVAVENPTYFTSSHLALLNDGPRIVKNLALRKSSEKLDLSSLQTTTSSQLRQVIQPFFENQTFQKNTLSGFLITEEELDAPSPAIALAGFDDLLNSDFRADWLKLYKMALSSDSQEDVTTFSIILSTFAYRGAPVNQIANLNCISAFKNTTSFPDIEYDLEDVFDSQSYSWPISNEFEVSTIEDILKQNAKPFTAIQLPTAPTHPSPWASMKYEVDLKKYETEISKYEDELKRSCSTLSYTFKRFWPCESIVNNQSITKLLADSNIYDQVIPEINERLKFWYHNYRLKKFLQNVQRKLNGIYDGLDSGKIIEEPVVNVDVTRFVKTLTQIKTKDHTETDLGFETLCNLSVTWKLENEVSAIFRNGRLSKETPKDSFVLERERHKKMIEEISQEILEMITNDKISKRIAHLAGLSPRLDPTSILKYLMQNVSKTDQNRIIIQYTGALGILWTHLKRLNRCIRALSEADIQREIDNPGHQNWSVIEYPEWLLLELELDIMIRPIQVEVAKQMMNMPNGGNGVTQLNMGEGKTSVIVPMLCCTLATANFQLCRVTVLSSMFNMNLNSLTFSIGGLMNRRVYSVPCKRDMEIDELCVDRIGQVYRECLEMKGVVLTLPEYRLSFRLLAYDNILRKNGSLGQKMLGIENFLRKYARDVLDESDELFSVKYQLVYTIGGQVPLDGGDLRWTFCQRILGIVQNMGTQLLEKFGTGMIEFDTTSNERSPHEFSNFRILSSECIKKILEIISDRLLEEVMISESEKMTVKQFLTSDEISFEDHEQVVDSIFRDTPDLLTKILIMSGYLRGGVLTLALTKRWRVEYGVNPKQGFRRMAVPLRAKDVAAEKTEFGHPDLAIILTHLSYYYSGLDDAQLGEVFEILRGKQAPNAIYSAWVSQIPENSIPDFLQNYYSLNMKDAYQKSKLFDTLRRHKMVVDFWLSHCVFPRESKQFPGKLVMTAWDLCYERQQHPVTGFSGTNDSKMLLPLMISQQDLPQLQTTNLEVEKTLLRPENRNHKGFQVGITCQEILMWMKQDQLTVLIDAGALMLECSNEQVADLWLDVDLNIEAAVYFSKDNELLVKCRGDLGKGTPFDVSPYQGRLDKCGVFLDDQHTRGTDLKFPIGAKGCVTIATKLKRDKLIQACMRMRKLGQGHSVTFYLSHEASDKVLENHEDITTQAVLDWVSQNTKDSNEDGLLYWALAGRNYAQRLAAEDSFHFPHDKSTFQMNVEDSEFTPKAEILARQCVDDEIMKLGKLYGQFMKTTLLSQIIPDWFEYTKHGLIARNNGQQLNPRIEERLFQIGADIREKCVEYAPNKTHQVSSDCTGMMEEEQEKELELEKEVEVEEERQVQRPRRANEAINQLHPYVESIVIDEGTEIKVENTHWRSILNLSDAFKSTSFWNEVQPQCWEGCDVFATKDFATVIKGADSGYHRTDSYLRPMQYLISKWGPKTYTYKFLLLSPFEVNELMPYFRRGLTKCRLHMFSLRRTEKQDLLVNNVRLQLPHTLSGPRIKIEEGSRVMASLLLACGNLYFSSLNEQRAFAKFLGLVPQPWSEEEREAFEKKMITKSGFLRSSSRCHGFDRDPTTLVKKILACRHTVVSEVTHVLRLLEEKRYIETD